MFSGSLDPAEAEDWLKKIQRIFAYIGLENHERVTYTYKLVGTGSFVLVGILMDRF